MVGSLWVVTGILGGVALEWGKLFLGNSFFRLYYVDTHLLSLIYSSANINCLLTVHQVLFEALGMKYFRMAMKNKSGLELDGELVGDILVRVIREAFSEEVAFYFLIY